MKPALMVIDMQVRFYNRSQVYQDSYRSAIEYINGAIGLFRQNNYPVIAILHQDKEQGLTPDAADFDMHPDINLSESDTRIIKDYGNAFNKTSLLDELKHNGVDTLILTGFCAEYCVLSTCRGAKDHDLMPILLKGSLASGNQQHITFVEEINDIISYHALDHFLNAL